MATIADIQVTIQCRRLRLAQALISAALFILPGLSSERVSRVSRWIFDRVTKVEVVNIGAE